MESPAHNPNVTGSNPVLATTKKPCVAGLLLFVPGKGPVAAGSGCKKSRKNPENRLLHSPQIFSVRR